MIKLDLFQGHKDGSIFKINQCEHHINKRRDKNHIIISKDTLKKH